MLRHLGVDRSRPLCCPSRTSANRWLSVVEHGLIFQASDERFKRWRNHRDRKIAFLVNMNYARLPRRTALSIVEAEHVMSCGRTVGEVDPDGGVVPSLDPEPTAERAKADWSCS